MFNISKKFTICLLMILMISSMTLISFAGGWDVSSASGWAKEELEESFSYDLVTRRVAGNFQNKITRAEFASLVVRLYEKLTNEHPDPAPRNTFSDTTDQDVLKAKGLGIVNGKGDGTFAPKALVTRQEMAIMYYKALDEAYRELGERIKQPDGILTMSDKDQVASWASKYVDFVYENNIIKGSNGNFNPLGNATREQAIVVLKRVYEKYKIEKEPDKFKIEKDGSEVEGIMNYGGFLERGEDFLKLKFGNGSDGPLALATDENNNLVKTYGYGVYEAKFKFNFLEGNAGYVFNVSSPKIGNEQYKGYFVGIKPENNTVFIGKANNNWKVIKSTKLPFTVKANTYYSLKTVKKLDRIDIYINDKKYISTSDNTYPNGGYFGPRGYKANVTYKHMEYDKDIGNLDPKRFYIINTEGEKLSSYKRYGGDWDIGETLTLIDDSGHKLGPMVLPFSNKSYPNLEVFPSSAIYEAKFAFKKFNGGNAGFAFNVSNPKVGNDNYKGYYVGINREKNTVQLGKANYNWTNLKEEKIPFNIGSGKITLRVEKVFSAMTVYVNGKKIFTVSDDTYNNDGHFGPRVWNTNAEYEYLKVEKLPF